jgi:hypothetical protein
MPRWPNGQGRLATNEESAGSTPARGARRSVAQRQSIGPTNRGAQVRVLPDRRWSWCSGPAFLTVTQAAPVRPRLITPWAEGDCRLVAPVCKTGLSGAPLVQLQLRPRATASPVAVCLLPVADPPRGFRSRVAPSDSGRKHSCRVSRWCGRRSAKPFGDITGVQFPDAAPSARSQPDEAASS